VTIDVKRGRFFLMERTAARIGTASFFQFHELTNHIDNIGAIEHLINRMLRNCHNLLSFSCCVSKLSVIESISLKCFSPVHSKSFGCILHDLFKHGLNNAKGQVSYLTLCENSSETVALFGSCPRLSQRILVGRANQTRYGWSSYAFQFLLQQAVHSDQSRYALPDRKYPKWHG